MGNTLLIQISLQDLQFNLSVVPTVLFARDRKRKVSVPFSFSSSTQLDFEYDMKMNSRNPYNSVIIVKPPEPLLRKSNSASPSWIVYLDILFGESAREGCTDGGRGVRV